MKIIRNNYHLIIFEINYDVEVFLALSPSEDNVLTLTKKFFQRAKTLTVESQYWEIKPEIREKYPNIVGFYGGVSPNGNMKQESTYYPMKGGYSIPELALSPITGMTKELSFPVGTFTYEWLIKNQHKYNYKLIGEEERY